jgi:hypothetical protein
MEQSFYLVCTRFLAVIQRLNKGDFRPMRERERERLKTLQIQRGNSFVTTAQQQWKEQDKI